jgi:Trp operon repressor
MYYIYIFELFSHNIGVSIIKIKRGSSDYKRKEEKERKKEIYRYI